MFRPMWRVFALVGHVLIGCLSPSALAAPTAEERAVALKYYELAVQAQEGEKWSECEGFIEQALAAAETPQLRFHLAYCLEMQQRWVEALLNYKKVEEAAQQSPDAAELEAFLAPALSSLQERLPTLKLVLEHAMPGVSLFIDGRERSSTLFGELIPLDPGPRTIEIVAAGYRPHRLNITLVPRDRRTVLVSLAPETPEPDRQQGAVRAEADTAKAVVLAAEGAVLVSGVVLGAVFAYEQRQAELALKDYQRQIGEPACGSRAETVDCRLWSDLNETVSSSKTAKYISFVGASVGAAALLTTWWLWPGNDREATALAVVPTSEGISAWLKGRF